MIREVDGVFYCSTSDAAVLLRLPYLRVIRLREMRLGDSCVRIGNHWFYNLDEVLRLSREEFRGGDPLERLAGVLSGDGAVQRFLAGEAVAGVLTDVWASGPSVEPALTQYWPRYGREVEGMGISYERSTDPVDGRLHLRVVLRDADMLRAFLEKHGHGSGESGSREPGSGKRSGKGSAGSRGSGRGGSGKRVRGRRSKRLAE
ncbi:hypothetical protein [Bifidobacterium vansinderenii]|uniref:Uncharacterized protein n=1 Tax=Bifidobacterium vansinderenii TaxID=1984871 RepID=A0A229VXR9_9BIFI|nr:hypothetical protein [Bifidobacterium vansinderenii]OXN00402.1 hypothetical protein Tam10B_1272 [Bifidobacterium vansinderenii]